MIDQSSPHRTEHNDVTRTIHHGRRPRQRAALGRASVPAPLLLPTGQRRIRSPISVALEYFRSAEHPKDSHDKLTDRGQSILVECNGDMGRLSPKLLTGNALGRK